MANAVYGYMRGRYFPNLVMSVNDENMTKAFYAFLAKGFLEGINAPMPEASGMADRVCGYIKAEYYPNIDFDDSETRAYHFMLAQAFLDGISA
jgi:hypothetical protein